MGDQILDEHPNGTGTKETSSYTILHHPASKLPDAYRNLIYSKFLRSLKYGNFFFRQIDNDTYFKNYHDYISILMNRPTSVINLAVLTDDPDVVLGWCLRENKTLHYVWVDKIQREQGIAKELCKEPFNTVTHMTHIGFDIFKKLNDIRFDPWG